MKQLKLRFYTLSIAIAFCIAPQIQAQDFVYTPTNPAFGGNPYNYSWLLSSANAQNTLEADLDNSELFNNDPLQDFTNSLNRQILSQLSSQIVSQQFGEESLEAGSYLIGNFQIDVTEGANGLEVSILDILSGDQTSIIVPYL